MVSWSDIHKSRSPRPLGANILGKDAHHNEDGVIFYFSLLLFLVAAMNASQFGNYDNPSRDFTQIKKHLPSVNFAFHILNIR